MDNNETNEALIAGRTANAYNCEIRKLKAEIEHWKQLAEARFPAFVNSPEYKRRIVDLANDRDACLIRAERAEEELAAHNPGSSAAGYVFNQMRKAFVALGASRHAFRPHVLVELASAVKADRDAFAIILRQISGFVDANGDKTPEARMATNALVEAARFMCPNDPSPEHKINAAGDQW